MLHVCETRNGSSELLGYLLHFTPLHNGREAPFGDEPLSHDLGEGVKRERVILDIEHQDDRERCYSSGPVRYVATSVAARSAVATTASTCSPTRYSWTMIGTAPPAVSPCHALPG